MARVAIGDRHKGLASSRVGAPDGTTFYALTDDGSSVYWKSGDRGETWSRVLVAGR